MKTIETIGTVTADGKMFVDVPKDLVPGKHRVTVQVDEHLEEDVLAKYGFDPKTTLDGRERKYFKGKPVLTTDEMARMDPELPLEPEWEQEWKKRHNKGN